MSGLDERSTSVRRGGVASWELKTVLAIAVSVLVLNIIFFVHQEFPQNNNHVGDSFTLSGGRPFHTRARVLITCCLVLVVVGLAVKKPVGVATSLIGVTIAVFLYGWWYRQSLTLLKNSEVSEYSAFDSHFAHAGGLWGANWWDITVLAIAVLLLIWHLTVFVRTANAIVIGSRF